MKRFIERTHLFLKLFLTYRNSYHYLFLKLGLVKESGPTVYRLFNGMKYKCRPHSSDFAILNENVIFKEYQRYFFPDLDPASLVIDFGAQAGSFSVLTAYEYGAQVYSFEPEKSNFQLLLENISINELDDNIIPINKAVQSADIKSLLYVSPHDNQGVHSIVYCDECDYDQVEVDCIDLDGVKKLTQNRRINFLKMDIEGSEHPLFDASYHSFWDSVDVFACEYHCHEYITDRKNRDKLVADIRSLGFERIEIVGDETIGLIFAARHQV